METPQFKIYRSSAGSGKTYRLAADYLKLALRNPQYYRKILAVTFTNKATYEMKARIIGNLDDLANGRAGPGLVKLLREENGWDEVMLQEKSRQVLKAILHGYSYFSVSTIDSFFQKVLTSFARDIEIHGGFTIEFDLDRVTDEILDMIFLDLERDPQLMNWLVRFTESKIEENKTWDVRLEVKNLAREIYYDRFFQYFDHPGVDILDKEKLSFLLKDLLREKSIFENRLRNFGKEGLQMMDRSGLNVEDLIYANQGPGGLFVKLASGADFNLSTRVMSAYENKENWYSKKSPDKERIMAMLDAGLFELYHEAIDFYNHHIRKQNTYNQVIKLFYNLGLYSNLLENLKKYRLEHGVILISDLSRLLRIIIGENDAPYIYERVGNHFQHFLMDEFQDTSIFQWQNFKPLVKNSLAMGNYNMLVGDIKQSIYRWRGGDWQLLQFQVEKDIGQSYINKERLNINWRSRINIIGYNNLLFEKLPGRIGQYYRDKQETENSTEFTELVHSFSERFAEVYGDAAQDVPANGSNKEGGAVSLRFISGGRRSENRIPWNEKVFDPLIEIIHKIQDRGYSLHDIAVLVRTRDEGKQVADFLLGYKNLHPESPYGYDVISSESLFLCSSPAINAVIGYMKLILDENDSLSWINLHYWLAVLKNGSHDDNPGRIFSTVMESRNSGCSIPGDSIDGSWRSLSLIDMLERIIQKLGLEEFPFEHAYLTGLQSVILDYLSRNKSDLHSFMDWWESDGKKQSIKPAEGQNAIQILTIHQSKGLEFEMVIIPFCSWNLDHMPNSTLLWCRNGDDLLCKVPYYPIRYESALTGSDFYVNYLDEQSLAYMDNLNLLYVAFTRAVSGLFVFAELPSDPKRIKTSGDVVFQVMEDPLFSQKIPFEKEAEDDPWGEEAFIYTHGDIPEAEGTKITSGVYTVRKYKKGGWYEKISIRKQPDLFSQEDEEFHAGEKIHYGILLHDLLSRIFLKDQADEVIDAEIKTGRVRMGQQEKIREMLNKLWENKKVEEWFTGKWQVKTEVPVLPRSGQISRMDRVMIDGDHIIVVDFKTGMFRPEHGNQVSGYKQILQQMGYRKVEGFLLYLGTGELVSV
ncbi:MAG: UvrD-helicase domain-containing protein [Cyclobacteriaceae bacterium]|nr:UvrD-helicase domain-containing protein [Cyclobacteriaceae bacterium]